jgi:predicted  nucleic acid-binding Zn-ribbon protein
MPTKRTMNPPKPSNERHELARLVRRIQALTLELQEPRRRHQPHTRELDAKEQMLEQLRWRLAAVARRSASDDLGNAA